MYVVAPKLLLATYMPRRRLIFSRAFYYPLSRKKNLTMDTLILDENTFVNDAKKRAEAAGKKLTSDTFQDSAAADAASVEGDVNTLVDDAKKRAEASGKK